jgi:1,2-diacylglycerol 3-beta-galactosyltransferase
VTYHNPDLSVRSFLPGQEAGNVDFVLEAGFGGFQKKSTAIAQEVADWLGDKRLLEKMSDAAKKAGHPHAASDIVLDMGEIAQTWMVLNGDSSFSTRV